MLTGHRGFVTLVGQLARGIEQTQRAVENAVADPVFVHVEANFRYTGGPEHAELIRFLEHRAWLVYDLLFGRVGEDYPLHDYLSNNGFSDEDFAYFREHTAQPDVLGLNYYPHMTTVEILPHGGRRNVWCGAEGLEELIRAFHARYEKPIFCTETSVPGPPEARVRWLRNSLGTIRRLRGEGLPVIGYTWWPLFSLVDWDYREGRGPVEEYLRHMGLYDLEPAPDGRLVRRETLVAEAFRNLIFHAESFAS
jgi:beta-glucosidase